MTAPSFVLDWLRTWEADQTVNGLTVEARPNIRTVIIEPWQAKDGVAGVADAQWTPNLVPRRHA